MTNTQGTMTMKNYKDWYYLNDDTRVVLSRGQLEEGKTPEQRYTDIAYHAQKILKIDGFAERMIEYFKKGWPSLSTPVLNNFGRDTGLPIACFGSYIGDSISSIFEKNSEIAHMTQKGGGTSFYLGALRPRGAKIKGGGISEGPVRFAEIFDKTVEIVNQGGIRRGACAAYLPADYENPQDVLDFLELREDHSPVQTLFLGLTFTDKWMEELKDDIANKRTTEKTKIWRRMLKKRDGKGFPYLLFKDNANNQKPQVYKDKGHEIVASNLCVHGDTLILTDKGHEKISDLVGKTVIVWNGEEWSETVVHKTGEDQELVQVDTHDGRTLLCTKYHKFYIQDGYGSNHIVKTAQELAVGDKLIKMSLPVIEGAIELKKAYTNGFFSGDGCNTASGKRIDLYNEKQSLIDFIETDNKWSKQVQTNENGTNRISTFINSLKDKFFVPNSSYTVNSRLLWFAGLLDADGTVATNGNCQNLQIGSINPVFLREIQDMLQTLGVNAKVTIMSEAGQNLLPDGKGGYKYYPTKKAERLLITAGDTQRLLALGLKCNRLVIEQRKVQRDAAQFAKIKSVTPVLGLHDTFCFTEPKRNMGVFNGILTGNCNEIMLPSREDESFVCCLASVNLLHYDAWKGTRFIQDMHLFLDAVMQEFIDKTEGIRELEAARNFAIRHRALGLGVLGYHSLFKAKQIPVESDEARELNKEIFEHMQAECLKANQWGAKRYGEPDVLKGYGLRNTTSMAIAPTLSSSFILGQVSAGIELDESVYYSKNNQKGEFAWRCPDFTEVLESYGQNNEEIWDSIAANLGSVQHLDFLSDHEKQVFKTFGEIDQKEVIVQAADRQKYIDQGQSLNLKYTSDTPLKVKSDHLLLAHELGLKGIYYQINESSVHKAVAKNEVCESCSA